MLLMRNLFKLLPLLLLVTDVLSAPPLKPDYHPGGRTCYFNETQTKRHLAAQKFGFQAFPSPASPNVLVIRVDFTDSAMATSLADTQTFFNSVQAFFVENSYGAFTPAFTISSQVHRLGTLATYGADCNGNIACNDETLRNDAVTAENTAGQNFSTFDHIMIYHAGNGQETSNVSNDIWSVFFPGNFTVDGKIFQGFTIVPETEAGGTSPLGVTCHEYGHQLGLPDLYDVSIVGGLSTVGSWDIMDYPYTNASGEALGSNPPHFGAWSKKFLGFVTPQIISSAGAFNLFSVNVASAIYRIPITVSDSGPDDEFFLIEYRNVSSTATYDKGIAASGVLIWHVDESIASDSTLLENNVINAPSLSGQSYRGVDLVEADLTEVYTGTIRGEAGDVFGSGSTFTVPQSNAFNGVASGILITGFSGVGTTQVSLTIDQPTIFTLTSSVSTLLSTTVATSYGTIALQSPAQAFADGSSVFLAAPSNVTFSNLGSASHVANLTATHLGMLLASESNQQPGIPLTVTLDFSLDGAVSGLSEADKQKLTLARYDSQAGVWVPLSSVVNGSNNTLTASLNHLSLFQIMQTTVGSSPNQVKIFPNPLRPSLGSSYAQMTFSNIPPESQVKIYSVQGNLIRTVRANFSGVAVWDGKNDSGRSTASGVYLALIEDSSGGNDEIKKIAVER